MSKTYLLKLTAAIAIAGELRTPTDSRGGLVEVDETLAKNLLHRGKARATTEAELAAAGLTVAPPADDEGTTRKAPKPTREELDAALASLPGEYVDADYVVNGMRGHFGALFTEADESKVRELVKAPPSAGLTVAQLKAALQAKGVTIPSDCNTKAELAALLDSQPAA